MAQTANVARTATPQPASEAHDNVVELPRASRSSVLEDLRPAGSAVPDILETSLPARPSAQERLTVFSRTAQVLYVDGASVIEDLMNLQDLPVLVAVRDSKKHPEVPGVLSQLAAEHRGSALVARIDSDKQPEAFAVLEQIVTDQKPTKDLRVQPAFVFIRDGDLSGRLLCGRNYGDELPDRMDAHVAAAG